VIPRFVVRDALAVVSGVWSGVVGVVASGGVVLVMVLGI
jgi:hypothetical protein